MTDQDQRLKQFDEKLAELERAIKKGAGATPGIY